VEQEIGINMANIYVNLDVYTSTTPASYHGNINIQGGGVGRLDIINKLDGGVGSSAFHGALGNISVTGTGIDTVITLIDNYTSYMSYNFNFISGGNLILKLGDVLTLSGGITPDGSTPDNYIGWRDLETDNYPTGYFIEGNQYYLKGSLDATIKTTNLEYWNPGTLTTATSLNKWGSAPWRIKSNYRINFGSPIFRDGIIYYNSENGNLIDFNYLVNMFICTPGNYSINVVSAINSTITENRDATNRSAFINVNVGFGSTATFDNVALFNTTIGEDNSGPYQIRISPSLSPIKTLKINNSVSNKHTLSAGNGNTSNGGVLNYGYASNYDPTSTLILDYPTPQYVPSFNDSNLGNFNLAPGYGVGAVGGWAYGLNAQQLIGLYETVRYGVGAFSFDAISASANFSAIPVSGINPLSVAFTNLSTNYTSAYWDLGDGSSVSAVINPTHIYNSTGLYSVSLTASDGVNQSVKLLTDYINVTTPAILSAFYFGNGNTGGTVPIDPNSYANGATVTVSGNTGSLVKTGYVFANWNTSADGSGITYVGGNTFNISANTNLYAQWLPTFSALYDANGSTSGSVPVDPNTYTTGSTVTVLGNISGLAKTGYDIFAGWNTSADGTGTLYVGGSTFGMGSSNVTLYAQWIEAGVIGSFYLGPIYASAFADTAILTINSFDPVVSAIQSVSANVIAPTVPIVIQPFEPVVYAEQDVTIDFSGVPVIGMSPLTVLFTGIVTFKGSYNNIYKVNKYIWYFDYGNNPFVYETTTSPQIYHVYTGYKGQQFNVKLEVILGTI
jgi:PKD repeat protein